MEWIVDASWTSRSTTFNYLSSSNNSTGHYAASEPDSTSRNDGTITVPSNYPTQRQGIQSSAVSAQVNIPMAISRVKDHLSQENRRAIGRKGDLGKEAHNVLPSHSKQMESSAHAFWTWWDKKIGRLMK